MKWCVVMVCVVGGVGCGGSQRRASDRAAQAREAERKRIEAMRPARPYEARSIVGYRAPDACGQGPYRIDAAALGAKFGEQFEVNICAPRSLEGDYRFTRGKDRGEPHHFGSRNNSEHCVATAAEAARAGTATNGSSSRASGAAPPATPVAGPPLATAATTALVPASGAFGEMCPGGMYLTGIVDFTTEMEKGDGTPWKTGERLVVDLWSAEPLYLDGAIFVVIQRGVRGDMDVAAWTRYRDEYRRWNEIWNAYLEGEVTAGRATYADMTARTEAPPPPRAEIKPPRPSTHAEWIAGYWQRDRTWIWSPGFWRVPDADIVAEQTIQAPVAPPPPKIEAPPSTPEAPPPVAPIATAPPPPTVELVWTPGYWSWNGNAYIWIAGAWRIPPQGGARWVAPSWTSRRGRFVLDPGGWSVRIRR